MTQNQFELKIFKTGTCWLWIGFKDKKGYGKCYFNKKIRYAHRVSYELNRSEIPKGLELDHLCRNPSCVNPEHLEAVTKLENIRRGDAGKVTGARQRAKIHCKQGHLFSDENLYVYADGKRKCKLCAARSQRNYIKRLRDS